MDSISLNNFLDLHTGQIRNQSGKEIAKLSSAESAILELLILNRGQCVSRDDMFHYGWPGLIVVDNSLTMAIRRIRNAGVQIQTVPRKGYTLTDEHIFIQQEQDVLASQNVQQLVASDVDDEKDEKRLLSNRGIERRRPLSATFWLCCIGYNFVLLIFLLLLESDKPNVVCVTDKDVEVCSTITIPQTGLADLSSGFYFYGYTYDDDDTHRFIKIH
ncbi:winged helix-turn-helix domain-containing protein [Vibrio azureus]|uniref:OmpR/PhoB-type domain-containing protein n=1 Tax=Vibrio azureus NBRC 104587 TaxID=1219077 RepID=U3CG64_9VIBR|nr:winged helix-turn-helix domain-containing protein [Vibrio azureus]GAD77283.1 hypothetical protein VAZ01S_069_00310 [Vibrio azureus NBRC 104587]